MIQKNLHVTKDYNSHLLLKYDLGIDSLHSGDNMRKWVIFDPRKDHTEWSSLIFEKDPLNPYLTIGLSYPYHLDESTLMFWGIRSIFYSIFRLNSCKKNSIAQDLELYCLSMAQIGNQAYMS